MRLSTFIILACMAAGIAFLSTLGFWQLKRLAWKENLIQSVEDRRKSEPKSLDEIAILWQQNRDVDFMAVKVSGTYDHSKEQFYYVTKAGVAGWHVFTPLTLVNGRILIVNRGFVPDPYKDQSKRMGGLTTGVVNIVGLARNAPSQKPNSFVPNNNLEKNVYHWKSITQMASQMSRHLGGKMETNFHMFFVDAGENSSTGNYPQGGSTRISFPNSHLSYAFTWFGLAFALLGVGSYFLYSRNKQN